MPTRTDQDKTCLLRPAAAARLLGVDVATLTRWAKAGHITALRTPGGHRRYRREDCDTLLTRHEGQAGDAA